MWKGTVKWFDPKKGFGFVINEKGEDVFVHYSSISGNGFRCLRSGQEVQFRQIDTEKGLTARDVCPVSETAGDVSSEASRQADETALP